MKNYKKILTYLANIAIILILTTTSYAAQVNTGSASAVPSASTVVAGKEFTITISAADASDVNSISFGQIQIYKSENTQNTTDGISVKSLDGASGDVQRFSEGNVTTFVYTGDRATSKEMCKIVLTTREDLSEGKYLVRIPNVIVYNMNDDETNIGTKDVEITIKKDTTTAGGTNTNSGTGTENTPKDTIIEESSSNNDKSKATETTPSSSGSKSSGSSSSSSSSTKKLPQTGLDTNIIIAIAIFAVFGTVSYVLYRKNKID